MALTQEKTDPTEARLAAVPAPAAGAAGSRRRATRPAPGCAGWACRDGATSTGNSPAPTA